MMKRSLRSTSPDCLNSNCKGTLTQSPAGITPCVYVCVYVSVDVQVCVCVCNTEVNYSMLYGSMEV